MDNKIRALTIFFIVVSALLSAGSFIGNKLPFTTDFSTMSILSGVGWALIAITLYLISIEKIKITKEE